MIEAPAAPVAIEFAQQAIRQSLQHRRSIASVAVPEAKAAVDFEGRGPSDPARGSIVDISI